MNKMSVKRPSENLSLSYSRRTFWRGIVHEVLVVSGMLKGGRECRLSELKDLPDAQLSEIRPMVHPSCEIFQNDGHVWSRCKDTGVEVKLFPVGETAQQVTLGMFDGHHTLRQVGERQAMEWDEPRAFAQARELFFRLADRLICVPRDPLDLPE
jgi:hypothetical protein